MRGGTLHTPPRASAIMALLAPILPIHSMDDMPFTPADLEALRRAHALLGAPGVAVRSTNLIGTPVEKLLDRLAAGWSGQVGKVPRPARSKAAVAALFTLNDQPGNS